MRLCRFTSNKDAVRVGLLADESMVLDLTPAGISSIWMLLEQADALGTIQRASRGNLPRLKLAEVELLSPVEHSASSGESPKRTATLPIAKGTNAIKSAKA